MIAIGSDHGGVELKDYLVGFLRCRGAGVGCGPKGANPSTTQILAASLCVLPEARPSGILICTSGIGMSIAANKSRVRAALVVDLEGENQPGHNDANILVLSGAKTDKPVAQEIVEMWLETPFAGEGISGVSKRLPRLNRISVFASTTIRPRNNYAKEE